MSVTEPPREPGGRASFGPPAGPPPRRTNPSLTRRSRGLRWGGGRLLLGRLRHRLAALPFVRQPLLERQGGAPRALEPLQLLAQHALLVGTQGGAFRHELLLEPVDLRLQRAGFTHPPPPVPHAFRRAGSVASAGGARPARGQHVGRRGRRGRENSRSQTASTRPGQTTTI